MNDWRAYVRRSLPPLPCPAHREAEIIEEVAQQLEQVYRRARAKGASEPDAVARAEAEVPDWQAMAGDLLAAKYPQTSGGRTWLLTRVEPRLQHSCS